MTLLCLRQQRSCKLCKLKGNCLSSTRTCFDCLTFTDFARLGEPKIFYEEMLDRLGG